MVACGVAIEGLNAAGDVALAHVVAPKRLKAIGRVVVTDGVHKRLRAGRRVLRAPKAIVEGLKPDGRVIVTDAVSMESSVTVGGVEAACGVAK